MKKLKDYSQSFLQAFKRLGKFTRYILVIVPLLAIFAISYLIQQQQFKDAGAAVPQAHAFFFPTSSSLPPDKEFKLHIHPQGTPLVFLHADVKFDPQLVRLTSLPIISQVLKRQISVSSLEEANSSGIFTIVLAANPGDIPPTDTFELATLNFTTLTADYFTTEVTLDTTSSLFASQDEQLFSISVEPLLLSLNEPPSPSPTPISTEGPVETPPPSANTAPYFVTKKLSTAKRGRLYAKGVVAADNNLTDVLYIEATNLPSDFSLSNCQTSINNRKKRLEITCQIKGTPQTKGKYEFSLEVVDQARESSTRNFTINVR